MACERGHRLPPGRKGSEIRRERPRISTTEKKGQPQIPPEKETAAARFLCSEGEGLPQSIFAYFSTILSRVFVATFSFFLK